MATVTMAMGKWAKDLDFANAVNQMQTAQLKADALKDVKNLGLLSLGVGAAGAGAIGLYNVLKRNKERSVHGPATLPMSLPIKQARWLGGLGRWLGEALPSTVGTGAGAAATHGLANLTQHQPVGNILATGLVGGIGQLGYEAGRGMSQYANHALAGSRYAPWMQRLGRYLPWAGGIGAGAGAAALAKSSQDKGASFLAGDAAATKGGIPWYGPAMLMGGLAGLGLGWKGTDYLLNKRRKAEGQAELDKARQEFNEALLAQASLPKAASATSVMEKVGKDLDRLFDLLQLPLQKEALDVPNMGGQALGGYGVYAGLSGLLTGAILYNQAKKRSRQAVLDAAMKRRARRQFMQAPTHIEAIPDEAPLDVTGGS